MAATRVFNSQRDSLGFTNHLSFAVCEWFLMFLMFVDAALSYLLTRFARYCDLQAPCLFCLRLDHLFGNEKPGSYLSLFCSKHRAEISSLISCHIHDKLADAREMCEECFESITMQNNPSAESYRFSVGGGFGMDGFQRPLINKNFVPVPLTTGACSCCNRTWKAKSSAQRLLQPSEVGLGASRVTVKPPLPRVSGRSRFCRRDSFKKVRDKISGNMEAQNTGSTGVDTLSHVGYTELRINSDSESEVPFSDDDDGSSATLERYDKAQNSNSTLAKHAHRASDPGPSLMDYVRPDKSMSSRANSLTFNALRGHCLEELNWEKFQAEPSPSMPVYASSSIPSDPFASLKQMPLNDAPSQPEVTEVPPGLSSEKSSSSPSSGSDESDIASPSNVANIEGKEVPETLPVENVKGDALKVDDNLNSLQVMTPKTLDHDRDKSDTSSFDMLQESTLSKSEGREVSGMLTEQNVNDVSIKPEKELKTLPMMLSSQEMNSPTYRSPRTFGLIDRSDASSSDGFHPLRGLSSLHRNDSSYESLDGSMVSEIEGENVVERLKRQVEYDRSCMHSLRKELEEERNAAAVAANQAMAMITRLQEEKASLHMEALQYLRMMEEQAEYDMEALNKANDLVSEKEKEIQDLELELEFYSMNCQTETNNLKADIIGNGKSSAIISEANASSSSTLSSAKVLGIKDEKLYISECLEKLERRLRQVSSLHTCNGASSERKANGVENDEELHTGKEPGLDHLKEESSLSRPGDSSMSNGIPSTDDKSTTLVEENNHVGSHKKNPSVGSGVIDLAILENEISDLHDRLEALEADRDFLEHACNSLQDGEGLQFIQEIAHQLQELRKIMFEKETPLTT